MGMMRIIDSLVCFARLWFFGALLSGVSYADAQMPLRTFWQELDKSVLVWGSLNAPSSVVRADTNNAKFEIYAKPNVRLWRLGEKTKITGYVIVAGLRDRKKLDYNSKVKFAVGMELQHKLTNAVRLSFGAKWDTEHRYFSGKNFGALIATADLSVYKSWRPDWLRRGRFSDAKLVLSGWANFRYPGALDPTERHNALLQGSLKLSAVTPIGNGKLKLAPFVSFGAKADTKGRPWNNTFEPALGVDLKIPLGKRGVMSVGAKAAVQLRHSTGQVEAGSLAYLSWYKHF